MEQTNKQMDQPADGDATDRRDFMSSTSSVAMAGGLVAGYGTWGFMAARFLYQTDVRDVGWQFVATVDQIASDASLEFESPSGSRVVIARQSEGNKAEDFIALSNVCPHLGCQVHWQPNNDQFFCPCHNGVFDAQGTPLEGPPKQAGQYLTRFPLKVEGQLLYVEVPLKNVTSGGNALADASSSGSSGNSSASASLARSTHSESAPCRAKPCRAKEANRGSGDKVV